MDDLLTPIADGTAPPVAPPPVDVGTARPGAIPDLGRPGSALRYLRQIAAEYRPTADDINWDGWDGRRAHGLSEGDE